MQLEEVYLLEGLGPTPEANHTGLTHTSFVELVSFVSISLCFLVAAAFLLQQACKGVMKSISLDLASSKMNALMLETEPSSAASFVHLQGWKQFCWAPAGSQGAYNREAQLQRHSAWKALRLKQNSHLIPKKLSVRAGSRAAWLPRRRPLLPNLVRNLFVLLDCL